MNETIEIEATYQKRTKSVIFWLGLLSCIYEAVINSLVASGVMLHPVFPALGVGLAAALIYCNGNNPSLSVY